MNDLHVLDDLVDRWENARSTGTSFTAEDITSTIGHSAEMEHRLKVVASMMSFLGLCGATTAGASAANAENGPRVLPDVPGYEVLEELGRGGMGIVYRARHLGLNRMVALKMVLDARHASLEELARFRSEAEAVAALQHPNIVQIFECGTHAGLPFFTLEYVPGGSLAEKVRESPLPPIESARLTEQMARGVAYAHDMGIIHRDLKPGNVLLAADATPKIADFGLAKRLGLGSKEDALTRPGLIVGTPSYMSPEQAGLNGEIGPAVDVWALGAILYKLLTGRPPFQAATPMETIRQVESMEPASPRRLNPAVPEDLNTVCLKCLQKDPNRRYASADALADDLKRFLAGDPVLARPVTRFERIGRWGRRNPAMAGLAAALLLVLAASLPVMTLLWRRAEYQRAQAVEQRAIAQAAADNARHLQTVAENESQIARSEAERAERVAQVLIGMFQASDPLGLDTLPFVHAYSESALTARPVLDRGAAQAMTGRQNDPLTQARMLDTLGNVYCTLGLTKNAAPLLERAVEIRRRTLPPDHPDLALSLHNLGWLHHQNGDYAKAQSLYREALAIRRQHTETAPLLVGTTLFNLAWLMADLEEFADAEKLFQKVLELRRKQLGDEHRDIAIAHIGLASVYIAEGKMKQALSSYLQGKAILAKIADPGLVEAIDQFQSGMLTRELPSIGGGMFGLDPLQKSERSFKKSLELARKVVGNRHPFVGLIHHELAQTLERRGQVEEAENAYRECWQIISEYGLEHPKAGIVLSNFSRVLQSRGKRAEAETHFAEALKAREFRYGPFHPLVADIKYIRADVLGGDKQEQLLREAIAIYRVNSAGSRLNYVNSLDALATLIVRQRPAEAEALLREALPLARKYVGHQGDSLAALLCDLANALIQQSKLDGVAEMLQEAQSLCASKAGITADTQRWLWICFSRYYLAKDRPLQAAEAVLSRRSLAGGNPNELFEVAAELTRCVARLNEDAATREKYAGLAMETLQQAAVKGFRDSGKLRDDHRLDLLRRRPDFGRIAAEVSANEKK